jgi:hypothetical protein
MEWCRQVIMREAYVKSFPTISGATYSTIKIPSIVKGDDKEDIKG